MKKIKVGVICPSEIAFRRFMPALKKADGFEYVGISSVDSDEWFGEASESLVESEQKKAENFRLQYAGEVFSSYHELLGSPEIDAVYLPLPPSLHFKWAKKALENGKHILLEKPFTTSLDDTKELISLAKSKNLAVHENYMFIYHSQIKQITEMLSSKVIGELRLIRLDFGFPLRGANDFRYNKQLGGGALLDCGGYTVKLASMLLGETAKITTSQLNSKSGFDVDIYGSATMVNESGATAQLSFGMDNNYKCSLELWGTEGALYTNRIFTAPEGFVPSVVITKGNESRTIDLQPDDTFKKSIEHFGKCIGSESDRLAAYSEIIKQSEMISQIQKMQYK